MKKISLRTKIEAGAIALLLLAIGVLVTVTINDTNFTTNKTYYFDGDYSFNGTVDFDNATFQHWGETASFIIFKYGSTIYAKNGTDGKIAVSSTNASTVIQYAIDNVPSAGGHIYIKAGVYTISSTITPGDNVHIEGAGIETTTLTLANNANCNMFADTSSMDSDKHYFMLENILLYGNKGNNVNSSAIYFNTSGAGNWWDNYFLNVGIYHFKEDGVYTNQTWGWHYINGYIENCDGNGFNLIAQNNMVINSVTINGNGGHGIYTPTIGGSRCNNVHITNCVIGENGGDGIHGIQECYITNNCIRRNSGYGIDGGYGCKAFIIGNLIYSNGKNSMTINGNDCRVDNNMCHSNNWSLAINNGDRNIINGMSVNAGDPSSAGVWNGNRIEGVMVWDTINSNLYVYANASWRMI